MSGDVTRAVLRASLKPAGLKLDQRIDTAIKADGQVVRNSSATKNSTFSLTEEDGALLKQMVLDTGMDINKSQLVRAGIALLATLPKEELRAICATVPVFRSGPKATG